MVVTRWLITTPWLVFFLYWGISAIGIKRDIRKTGRWWNSFILRILFAVGVLTWILLFRRSVLERVFGQSGGVFVSPLSIFGIILCISGIALAIYARWHLGRNWSYRPAIKEGHELVTSGPYRVIRHPIYAGILTALLGTALTGMGIWLYFFLMCCLFVIVYRIRVEEQLMVHQFPEEYPGYRKKTKALIPFVW